MSLRGFGTTITMTEGDYGITLPIIINGGDIGVDDSLRITIISENVNEPLLTKEFTNISDNTLQFVLTKDESDKLPTGVYIYSLDWYKNDEFLCNLVRQGLFEVEKKV